MIRHDDGRPAGFQGDHQQNDPQRRKHNTPPADPASARPRGMTRLDAASKDYLPRGWTPIPIPTKSKRPIFKAWQKYKPENGKLERDFQGKGNIGLLLGEPSDWLTDVDLDWPEAMALAKDF